MKHSNIEHRLAQAIENACPDRCQEVLNRCQPQKGNVITMTEPKKRGLNPLYATGIAACFAVLIFGAGLVLRVQNNALQVASIVSLDVNPNVQLSVNEKSEVVRADAMNLDGETILKDMDLKGTPLNVAVNAIVGSLLQHGYVDELANSVLVTVEDDNAARAQQLQNAVTEQVTSALNTAQVNGSVLSQTVNHSNNPLQAKADEYGISLGKATLIDSLVKNSDHLKFEDLVGLSVNELNLLTSQQTTLPNNVTSNGSAANNSSYIGVEAAKNAAFAHAGADAASATILKTDYDYEMGKMVYEIEFLVGTVEYEYDIDALTGSVVKFSREDKAPAITAPVPTPVPAPDSSAVAPVPTTAPSSNPSATMLSAEQAKSTALSHAGQSQSTVWDLSVELDQKNGHTIFDVDFESAEAEYEYWIEAYTGEILRSHKEPHIVSNPQPPAAPSATISSEQARDIALQQAGLSLSAVYDLEVELDHEDGILVYKVEFESAGMDYEYEIDASTGNILQIG